MDIFQSLGQIFRDSLYARLQVLPGTYIMFKGMSLVKNDLAIAKILETSILSFWLLSVYSMKSVLLKHLD